MAEKEVKLMKGNEVIAHAAIRYGCDGYFGYPITPQSEVMETLMELKPWETTGMVVLQAESEISSINMVYGGASTGKRVMTSSSSPGISLMSEGLSYLAGAELPCLIINCQRGGPGLGTIQPSQGVIMIGKAGKSLQAFNRLVKAAVSAAFKKRIGLLIDVNGYKEERYEKICKMAVRIAKDVRRTKVDAVLDPMPADERKAIHNALAGMNDISTKSEGEGEGRRLHILYTPGKDEE